MGSAVGRTVEQLSPGRSFDTASIRPAIQGLAEALPESFAAADQLLADLEERSSGWQEAFAAVTGGEQAAWQRLPAVANQIQAFRRSLLLAMRGMPEFLAANAHKGLEVEWERQFQTLAYDLRNRAHFTRVAPETLRPEALIHGRSMRQRDS